MSVPSHRSRPMWLARPSWLLTMGAAVVALVLVVAIARQTPSPATGSGSSPRAAQGQRGGDGVPEGYGPLDTIPEDERAADEVDPDETTSTTDRDGSTTTSSSTSTTQRGATSSTSTTRPPTTTTLPPTTTTTAPPPGKVVASYRPAVSGSPVRVVLSKSGRVVSSRTLQGGGSTTFTDLDPGTYKLQFLESRPNPDGSTSTTSTASAPFDVANGQTVTKSCSASGC